MNRFLIVQEPTCTWAVFDTFSDVPAELEDQITIGLEKREASALAAKANTDFIAKNDATILRAA